MSDPATSPPPAPGPSRTATVTIRIVKPTGTILVPSPLEMHGWFEPPEPDELEVWYRKDDGTDGEGPVGPNTTPDPNNPDRVLFDWTFSNALTSGQVYIAYARVKKSGIQDQHRVTFTAR